jgi:hypothetical protein
MADCPKVRAMLATPEGDILPAWVESHLWACEGCQGFRAESRSSAPSWEVLPVEPSEGLRERVLRAARAECSGQGDPENSPSNA